MMDSQENALIQGTPEEEKKVEETAQEVKQEAPAEAVEKIEAAVEKIFDCTPAGIIKTLKLKQPIYRKTASYGHFGRTGFPWEETDKVEQLLAEIK